MTAEETQQVNAYIATLQAQHLATMQAMQAGMAQQALVLQGELKYRKLAQADSLKMGTAVHEIMKLSRTQPPIPPDVFATCVKQIVNHYCPDYDIPF